MATKDRWGGGVTAKLECQSWGPWALASLLSPFSSFQRGQFTDHRVRVTVPLGFWTRGGFPDVGLPEPSWGKSGANQGQLSPHGEQRGGGEWQKDRLRSAFRGL